MALKAAPAEEGMDQKAKIKMGVAIGVLVIAVVWIANTVGIINLWGGEAPSTSKEPPPSPEQVKQRQVQIQEAKQAAEEASKRPGTVRAGE